MKKRQKPTPKAVTVTAPKPEPEKCVIPGIYLHYLPIITKIGRKHDYAIGLHGSMRRDLDLIAVPWTDKASPCGNLVLDIHRTCGDHLIPFEKLKKEAKPHNRVSYAIPIGAGLYIDLSVMPLCWNVTWPAGNSYMARLKV